MSGHDFETLSRLMARALANDDAGAYEAALLEIARIVRAYARARVEASLADDIVQETLLSVHRARHTYDPKRPIGPWLIAIAHSRLVDAARRVRRQALREEPLDPHQVGGVESGADTRLRVSTALQQLPERQRRVIELLKLQGWKAKDVASALGLSVSNVKVIAHRGYHALRRTLKDEA